MLRLGKLREKEMSLGVSIGVVFIMQTWGTQLNFPYERKRAATSSRKAECGVEREGCGGGNDTEKLLGKGRETGERILALTLYLFLSLIHI